METALVDTNTGELVAYSPEETKTNVAKADALIDYATKVKDATLIERAVDEKVERITEFVRWWESNVSRPGNQPINAERRYLRVADAEQATGIRQQQVSRWRKATQDEEKFKRQILEAALKKADMLPADNHRAEGTGENEWYTPSQFIEAARLVMGGIDLDPATSETAQKIIRADDYFTAETNGLVREWHGRVWLNPPYSRELIGAFMDKLCDEFGAGRVEQAIVLTHNYTDTAWFHSAESVASAICFTRGRIPFVNSEGDKCSPTQGQAFFYVGDNVGEFTQVFTEFGFVR